MYVNANVVCMYTKHNECLVVFVSMAQCAAEEFGCMRSVEFKMHMEARYCFCYNDTSPISSV